MQNTFDMVQAFLILMNIIEDFNTVWMEWVCLTLFLTFLNFICLVHMYKHRYPLFADINVMGGYFNFEPLDRTTKVF